MHAESLKCAFEDRDPYNPKPMWQNFRGLFGAIDEGNAGLNIPAYNGGRFTADPALDALPPAFITRYIVEQVLSGVLKQDFESLCQQQETEATGSART